VASQPAAATKPVIHTNELRGGLCHVATPVSSFRPGTRGPCGLASLRACLADCVTRRHRVAEAVTWSGPVVLDEDIVCTSRTRVVTGISVGTLCVSLWTYTTFQKR
jgi:hypothetical protein